MDWNIDPPKKLRISEIKEESTKRTKRGISWPSFSWVKKTAVVQLLKRDNSQQKMPQYPNDMLQDIIDVSSGQQTGH